MTYEEIEQEWEKDSKINNHILETELSKLGILLKKYNNFLFKEKQIYLQKDLELVYIKSLLYDYYQGRADAEQLKELNYPPFGLRLLKPEVELKVYSDKIYMKKYRVCEHHKFKIDYILDIIKHLHSRGFNIKSMIEFMKYTNGID